MYSTIDAHVAGEAFRIVVHSSITLDKGSIYENHDYLHTAYQNELDFLLNEPRGHQGMHGCIVIPSSAADLGVLFFAHHQDKVFSYSGLIATITALLETGNLARKESDCYNIETINGLYTIKVTCENEQVNSVILENRGTRVVKSQSEYCVVEVDECRRYLVMSLPDGVPGIQLYYLSTIIKWSNKTSEKYSKIYPDLSGIILTESHGSTDKVRSITFDPNGNIVRSPGIDSTFAIFASRIEDGREHVRLTNKSIFDSTLTAHLIDKTNGRFSLQTKGFTTGMHQFMYDTEDPLKNGFLLK